MKTIGKGRRAKRGDPRLHEALESHVRNSDGAHLPDNWQLFSSLVETLYRDAYAGSSWTATLGMLAQQFRARDVLLLLQDASGILGTESASAASPEPGRAPRSGSDDPMLKLAGETPTSRNSSTAGVDHCLGFNVRSEKAVVYGFRLLRESSAPAFTSGDEALCRALTPHIRRAVDIRRTMVLLQTERILLGRAVNRYDTAVITLDRSGRVLEVNDCARALLRESSLIQREDDRIALRDVENDRQWSAMLRAAITATREASRSRTLGAMPLHDHTGKTRLGLLLRSIPRKQSVKDPLSPAFALYIRDALAPWVAPSETIRKLLRITAAEASLTVHITRGLSIQEAATEMGISPHTAKSHLQAIFVKLGISKQADLVRIALSSVAAIG